MGNSSESRDEPAAWLVSIMTDQWLFHALEKRKADAKVKELQGYGWGSVKCEPLFALSETRTAQENPWIPGGKHYAIHEALQKKGANSDDKPDTPRTDEATLDIGYYWPRDLPEKLTVDPHDGGGEVEAVRADFARQLERELAEAHEARRRDVETVQRAFHNASTPSAEGNRDAEDAARYRRIRFKAWLDSCVDDLVVNTPQAIESEFNAGYDAMIETEYPDPEGRNVT